MEMKKSELTHGSLFSGIGGFELGAEMAGIDTLWNCEIEKFQGEILKNKFPHDGGLNHETNFASSKLEKIVNYINQNIQ